MRINRKGMTITEVILIALLFIGMAGAFWYLLSRRTQSNQFRDKSQQVVHNRYYIVRHYSYSLAHLVVAPFNFGGCTRRPDVTGDDQIDAQDIQEAKKVSENDSGDDTQVNAIVNTTKP